MNPTTPSDSFLATIQRALSEVHGAPVCLPQDESANLFNAGLVDSFKLPRLVAAIERFRGEALDLTRLDIEAFYSIASMRAAFLTAHP
ncbi:MAG: hypothetical protein ABWY06_04520 [Pseudomonas sp.]|uniref:hypothetical protein n=1 Tax=Pseudomonas sp. TaxID=306 RepID=UPI00339848A7